MSWSEIEEKIDSGYTVSLFDMCEELKCSRTFASDCIAANMSDYLFLDTGVRGGGRSVGFNFLKATCAKLDVNLTGSKLYQKDEYRNFVLSHLKAYQRTKSIPAIAFMDANVRQEYAKERIKLNDELISSTREFEKIFKRSVELWKEYMPPELVEYIYTYHLNSFERAAVEWFEIALPPEDTITFIPISEYKNRIGVDEKVHREFFSNGFVKLKLSVPDKFGEVCSKIYYLPDTNYIHSFYCDTRFIFDYATYMGELRPLIKEVSEDIVNMR